MWSSYKLLNPWRAWGGGHRSTSDWAKVKSLVLPVGRVSLIQTIPQDFLRAYSPPQPQSYPHALVCLWCSSHIAIEASQLIKPAETKSFFLQLCGLTWPKGVQGVKGKQQELTARHRETMGWRWKENVSSFSTDELCTSPHGLAPQISKENNIPDILVNSKDFIECFEMYLD